MKHLFLVFTLCLCSQLSMAQFTELLKSSNQQLVEDAVREGLVVVRQDYNLKDTSSDNTYGRAGNDYFGRMYSLGVLKRGGLYVSRSLMQPWEKDEYFVKYREDSAKKPVISHTCIRQVDASEFAETGAEWDKAKISGEAALVPDSISRGFHIDTEKGEKNGWIVLVTSDEDWTKNDSLALAFDIYKTTITVSAEENSYEIKAPATSRKILGGIYVCPIVTAVGQLTFMLTGWVSEVDGKWKITTFTENLTEEKAKNNIDDELNLIQNGGKNRPGKRSRK